MPKIKKEENNALTAVSTNMPAPVMPLVPELLANAMPVPVPQMEWESGIVQDFFHNWKKLRMVRATDREACISENKNRHVKANLDTIHEIVTFSKRMEASLKQYNHQMTMMDITEQRARAELVEQQFKNLLLQNEVKLSELEFRIKSKEMEAMLNGTDKAQDRAE
ncbi:MAG: hypothetical protein M1461_13085 [Nitrospirae bacterium]|nr:hypothetical protein [Nitrospirota bacterium]